MIPQRYGWLPEPEAHWRCKALNLAWSPGTPESPCVGGCSRSADCRAAPLGLSLSAFASGRGRSVRRQYGRGRGSRGPRAVGRMLRSGDLRQQQHHPPGECHGVDLAVGCPTSEGSGRTGSVPASRLRLPSAQRPRPGRSSRTQGRGSAPLSACISPGGTRTYHSRGGSARVQPTPPGWHALVVRSRALMPLFGGPCGEVPGITR